MDIELIFKVAGVGIIVSVLNVLLKKAERDEQALMTTLAGLVVVLMLMIEVHLPYHRVRDKASGADT